MKRLRDHGGLTMAQNGLLALLSKHRDSGETLLSEEHYLLVKQAHWSLFEMECDIRKREQVAA